MTDLCRWAQAADDEPARKGSSKRPQPSQGQGSSKRPKALLDDGADDDYDGLTAGLDGFFGKKQGHRGMPDNAKANRGVLKKVMPLLHQVIQHNVSACPQHATLCKDTLETYAPAAYN